MFITQEADSGFKAFFGDVNNKDTVMSILNVLLPEHRRIVDMEVLPTEHQGPVVELSKEYHYDFMCRDASGVVFIVELQKYWSDDWFKRCVSYASRAYDRQNRRGEGYNVPPVYLIGLMDVPINHPDKEFWRDKYISEYTFREKESHDLLAETIVIIFAEMANFSKTEAECLTETDQMLYVLKNIGRLIEQPSWLQKEVFDRIFTGCEIAGFNEDKRIIYEQEMYDERKRRSEMNTAIRMGREEGRAEGRVEGIKEAKLETATNMKARGISDDIVAECTGLSIELVRSL